MHPTPYSPFVPHSLSGAGELGRCVGALTYRGVQFSEAGYFASGVRVLKMRFKLCYATSSTRFAAQSLFKCFYVAALRILQTDSGKANLVLARRGLISLYANVAHHAIEYSKSPKQQSAALQQAQSLIRFNTTQTRQRPHNKTLQPTAYSSVRSSLRFQRRLNSVVVWLRAAS